MTSRLMTLLTAVFAALALVFIFMSLPQQAQAVVWQDKVDPWVLQTATSAGSVTETEFLLYLTEQADLSGAANLQAKEEKGQYVYDQLTAVAAQSQPALTQELDKLGVAYEPFWIANMVWVRGDGVALAQLARRTDVAHVYANPIVAAEQPETAPALNSPREITAVEWNVTKIGAPAVWDAGYTGQGIVIGGQDTGYQWEHTAIKEQYRGWDGATVDHNYSWHDAIHEDNPKSSGTNSCDFNSPEPCDDGYHGTHTMGTMVGDDGDANQIGVAPGAQWIGCRNMENGWGTPATYAECYQWFIAPTDLNGENPDTSKAPHVINNSWACPVSEGCTDPNVLLAVVDAVRAAGIVTVHSAGNSGSSCSSISTPAAIYDSSFTVGNTTSTDAIASSSSRGPVLIDGSGRLKPDVSAPGSSIRSSIPGGSYTYLSGTSMAGPHVAGQVALLLSARPDLIGDVDEIERIIRETAVPLTTTQTCGSTPGTEVPNNTYGWGRIDAWNMLISQGSITLQTQTEPVVVPSEMFTYTFTITNDGADTHQLVLTNTMPAAVQFITATMPYTQVGDTIRWAWPTLLSGENETVDLVVQVAADIDFSPLVDQYQVSSQETETITGELETAVLYISKYFPVFMKEP